MYNMDSGQTNQPQQHFSFLSKVHRRPLNMKWTQLESFFISQKPMVY